MQEEPLHSQGLRLLLWYMIRTSITGSDAVKILSFIATVGMLAMTLIRHDACGCLGVAFLAVSSSLFTAVEWRYRCVDDSFLTAKHLPSTSTMVMRTREGSFIVVHMDQAMRRRILWLDGDCDGNDNLFLSPAIRLSLFLVGLILYPAALMLLSNSRWEHQAFISGIWALVSALEIPWPAKSRPPRVPGSRPAFTRLYAAERSGAACLKPDVRHSRERERSFARALWYACQTTKSVHWVFRSGAVPETPEWTEWLKLVKDNLENPDWPAVSEQYRCMGFDSAYVYGMPPPQEDEESGSIHRREEGDPETTSINPENW